jgi:spore germination protein GerM
MAKRKAAVKKTATPAVKGDKKVATTATNSSPAPATKKAEKTPKEKVVPKTPLETKTVCFTDKDTGKKFCGEMTEVPPSKDSAEVAGTKKKRPLFIRGRRK